MKKKALKKEFRREVKGSLNRFLSIFFIVAMGVAFYSGIQSSAPDMRATGDYYFDQTNLMDLRVISTLGVTEADLETLRKIEGVASVSGCYMEDVLSGEGDVQNVLHAESIPDQMNLLTPRDGRLPEQAEECFLDSSYADAMGYQVGDTLKVSVSSEEDSMLKYRSFTICGIGYSPCYVSFSRGSSTLGDGSVDGFVYVLPEAFDSEVCSVAYVRAEGSNEAAAFGESYEALIDAVYDRIDAVSDVRCEIRYEEILSEAQSELDEAKQEIADGKQELADAKQELEEGRAEAQSELDEAQSELTQGESELADGRLEVADAKQEIAEGESELADGEAEITANEAKLSDARGQIADARGQLTSGEAQYREGMQEYQTSSAQARKELEAAQKQIEDGKKALQEGWNEYEKNAAVLSDGEKQLQKAEQELKNGQKEYEAQYEKSIAQLDAGMKAYQAGAAEMAAGRAAYEKGKAELSAKQKEYDTGRAQLDEGWTQYHSGAEQLAAGQRAYDAAAVQAKEYQSAYDAAAVQAEQLQAAYDAASLQAEPLKRAYEESAAKQEQLQAAYDGAAAQNQELHRAYEEKAVQNQTLHQTYDTKTEAIRTLRTACETETERVRTLQSAYDGAVSEAAVLQSDWDSKSAELSALRTAQSAAEQHYAALQGQFAERTKQKARKEADLTDARTMYDTVQEIIRKKEEKGEDASAEKEQASSFVQIISGLEAEIASLQAEISGLEGQLPSAEQAAADAKAAVQAKEADVSSVKSQLDAANAAASEYRVQLDHANASLSSSKAQLEAEEAALPALKAELDASDAALPSLKAELEASDTALAVQKAETESSGAALAAQKAELDGVLGALAQQKEQTDRASAALVQQKAQIDAMNAELTAQKAVLEQSAAALTQTKQMLDQQEQTMTAGKASLEAGWNQINASEKELLAGEAKLAESKRQLDEGYAQLEAAGRELEEGKIQLEAKKKELKAGKAELAKGKETLEKSEKELEAGQKEIDDGYAQLEAAGKELTAARSELDLGWAQLNASLSQLSDGERQITDARAQLDKARSELADAKQKILDAEKEIAENEQKIRDGWADYEDGKLEAEQKIADAEQEILEAENDLTEAEQEIADAQADLAEIKVPTWYVDDRAVLPEYSGFDENAERLANIGKVFPVLFFLVAALISLTTMTRMVEEERTQIGTMKALGYSKTAIASKYLKYAFYATIGGSVFGVLFGEKVFPWVIITAYGIMYEYMPKVVIPYNWTYALIATGAALLCTIGATLSACYRTLQDVPAQLMRPPAPKDGKRVLLEYLPFIWKRLGFNWKSTIRNLMRYKKRCLMTILGISGCMGLLLVGYGLRDSIMGIGALQFEELQRYDAMVIFNTDASKEEQKEALEAFDAEPGITRADRYYMQLVDVQGEGITDKEWSVYLYVPYEPEHIGEYFTFRDRETLEQYELTEEGAVITEKLAKTFGVQAGDTIRLKREDDTDVEVPVAEVCENYLSHYLYLTPALYEQIYGEQPEYNSMLFRTEGSQEQLLEIGQHLLTHDAVLNITYALDLKEQIDSMLVALDSVMIVLILSAGALAFVVLYNLNNININERKRELATIKVLGFHNLEVAAYVYRENILLTIAGAAAGIFMGKVLHAFIITTVEVDNCMFARTIHTQSFVYGVLYTILFSVIVNVAMYFKLKKIDMVESLKSIE